jgi:hypothetical protein
MWQAQVPPLPLYSYCFIACTPTSKNFELIVPPCCFKSCVSYSALLIQSPVEFFQDVGQGSTLCCSRAVLAQCPTKNLEDERCYVPTRLHGVTSHLQISYVCLLVFVSAGEPLLADQAARGLLLLRVRAATRTAGPRALLRRDGAAHDQGHSVRAAENRGTDIVMRTAGARQRAVMSQRPLQEDDDNSEPPPHMLTIDN